MMNFIAVTYQIVLTALIGYIVWSIKEQKTQKKLDNIARDERLAEEKKMRESNNKGTMLLLRVQLIEYHDKYVKKGSIPSYAYQNFLEMYEVYHELGGNGMVTKMKEEIEELHFKRKEDEEVEN